MKDINYPLQIPYTYKTETLLEKLYTKPNVGLSDTEAKERNTIFGLNSFKARKKKSLFKIFTEQFKNPIVALLGVACLIAFLLGDVAEGIAIIVVILINAFVGFFMEVQAMNSMDALQNLDKSFSRVLRNGKTSEINSEEITVGDIVLIEAGDVIPADGRMLEINQLEINESALTGESLPVMKTIENLPDQTPLADQTNMVFKGTSVVKGNGKVVITTISDHTELGKISKLVESAETNSTPLEKKLEQLTKKLIWITLVIAVIFFINGAIQGKSFFLIIETAIALAIAAIPEGLPIVATVALAYGMLRMARKNAIVKKLTSVETLGGTNIIFTDKTGTLTENKIFVSNLLFFDENINYEEREKLSDNKKDILKKLVQISALCNNAEITDDHKEFGDPLEVALLKFVTENNAHPAAIKAAFPRIAEEPFSSETKIMCTLHGSGNQFYVAAKGSVEDIIKKCNGFENGETTEILDATKRNEWIEKAETLSGEGLRVLAFAYKIADQKEAHFSHNLILAGLIGFLDPPREDVPPAVQACKEAGIRVIMITGDHPKTALNIARKVGIVNSDDQLVITGTGLKEPKEMSEAEKEEVYKGNVFARVTPKQKLDMVSFYQEKGNIIAMTGDGVNDAPALKKSDIGIAMGLRGTQVARETADIILKDDAFTSIAAAIAQGRGIFQNIKKFIIYLLSCNLSEIFIVAITGFIDISLTLLPLQILFINLVTDVFPALALGMGKESPLIMKYPPRDPASPVIDSKDWRKIVLYASVMTAVVTIACFYCYYSLNLGAEICNNVIFFSLAFSQIFHVLNMYSGNATFIKNEITQNIYVWAAIIISSFILIVIEFIEPLVKVLSLVPMNKEVWMIIFIAAVSPVIIIQILKKIFYPKN